MRSLFGWGYYLVAPALLLGSYILLFHRGRNVASCLVGTALLPVVFGAIMHIALCKEKYVNMDGILKLLWTSGNALESGGAVSASLAIMLVLLVKKVLAMVLLVVLFVAFLMMAFRLTPAAVIEAVRSHERVPMSQWRKRTFRRSAPMCRAAVRRSTRRTPPSTFRSTARSASSGKIPRAASSARSPIISRAPMSC